MADNPYRPPEAPEGSSASQLRTAQGQLASRWQRLGGALVDGIISSAVAIPMMIASGYWGRAMAEEVGFLDDLLWTFGELAVFLVLHGYTLHTRGQTLGKVLLRMQIVSRFGYRVLPLSRVFILRYVPFYLVVLVPIFGPLLTVVEVLFIFGSDKRCLHDHIAGTIVIKYREDESSDENTHDRELENKLVDPLNP